ncbi:MAG: prenyltransferase, partial [Planctomycetes bacterium]|nr:prenyltransferase [Planctomycetota bacterium]
MKIATLRAWFTLSKPLTHVLGILPFSLGGVLAWNLTGSFDWAVFGLGIFGALLLMLVACYSGEYFDFETDTLAIPFRNRFSGGSQVLQKTDTIEPIHSLIAAFVCLILAGIIGVLLQFHFKTGPLTIPLGILAMIAAFFYSAKPIQWAYIGLGEIWIWLAYGWLSVATPFYLLTGGFVPVVHWASLPIAFTI